MIVMCLCSGKTAIFLTVALLILAIFSFSANVLLFFPNFETKYAAQNVSSTVWYLGGIIGSGMLMIFPACVILKLWDKNECVNWYNACRCSLPCCQACTHCAPCDCPKCSECQSSPLLSACICRPYREILPCGSSKACKTCLKCKCEPCACCRNYTCKTCPKCKCAPCVCCRNYTCKTCSECKCTPCVCCRNCTCKTCSECKCAPCVSCRNCTCKTFFRRLSECLGAIFQLCQCPNCSCYFPDSCECRPCQCDRKSPIHALIFTVIGVMGAAYGLIVSSMALKVGPLCRVTQLGEWRHPFKRGDYLNDPSLWIKCLEPENVIFWHVLLFSILLVISTVEFFICVALLINILLTIFCGDKSCFKGQDLD